MEIISCKLLIISVNHLKYSLIPKNAFDVPRFETKFLTPSLLNLIIHYL